MPDEEKDKQPVEKLEAPVPQEEELSEERVVSWLRKKGIDSDVEGIKTRMTRAQELEEAVPKYEEALSQFYQLYQQNQQKAVPKVEEDDEEELRNLARLDPYEYDKRVWSKREKQLQEAFAQRMNYQTKAMQAEQSASERLKVAYPDVYDQNSELFKTGMQIYWKELSDIERAIPGAFYGATERAAGRLGIAPRDRKAPVRSSRPVAEVAAQNVGGARGKPPKDDDDGEELTSRDKKIASAMDLDPKTLKAAKANRKRGGALFKE
jgi:hypothetical protein